MSLDPVVQSLPLFAQFAHSLTLQHRALKIELRECTPEEVSELGARRGADVNDALVLLVEFSGLGDGPVPHGFEVRSWVEETFISPERSERTARLEAVANRHGCERSSWLAQSPTVPWDLRDLLHLWEDLGRPERWPGGGLRGGTDSLSG